MVRCYHCGVYHPAGMVWCPGCGSLQDEVNDEDRFRRWWGENEEYATALSYHNFLEDPDLFDGDEYDVEEDQSA